MARVAAFARPLGDGLLAVLGHSMASDIVVRFAKETPDVVATIAVSMFSPVVTATSPRNLLVVVGEWEGMLKAEALRAVGLAIAPAAAEPGITYGGMAAGTARRPAFSTHVEHASVLFSQATMRESLMSLDAGFGIIRAVPLVLDARGPWIMLLLAASVALARPYSTLLPRLASSPVGAGLGWRELRLSLLAPMAVTPLLLRVVPTHFLPVLVGDYLAAHFAVYGPVTMVCLAMARKWLPQRPVSLDQPQLLPFPPLAVAGAALAVIMYGFAALVWPVDQFVTSFVPGPERFVLVAALMVGTSLFMAGDEWLTRGDGAARGAYAATKLAFLLSLGAAVALDFVRLFFLLIIVPVIVLFFIIHGLFSAWTYRQTGQPLVAGIANAFAFAWAVGVAFPLLAG